MARPIWSGTVNFGLVSIPVRLYSATQDHTVHFRQIERGTSDRVRYQRVNERTGKEVDYGDIVKGREIADGEYVVVEPEELDAIAPGRSRSIDIDTFVDLDEIDPIYFQKTYWLGPGDTSGSRPYGLLVKALEKSNRAGICNFVMRGKEYLAAIRADDGVLALDTLFFADEIRRPKDQLGELPDSAPRGKELDMAISLVDSMAGPWKPEDYSDTYTERVEQLIEDKAAGRTIKTESEPPESTNVVDLSDALRRSVEAARGGRGRKGSSTGGRKKKESADLSELSKSELDRIARDLDVPGRSKMRRDELEKAIKGQKTERADKSAS